MIDAIIVALSQVGQAALLFILAYLTYCLFGVYFNVKVLQEKFSWRRLALSAVKIVVFSLGMALLTIVIAALPVFANSVGWGIPEEYINVFSVVAIVFTFLRVAAKYTLEAFGKLYNILDFDGNTLKAEEIEDISA